MSRSDTAAAERKSAARAKNGAQAKNGGQAFYVSAEKIYPSLRRVQTLEGDDRIGKVGAMGEGISLQRLAQLQR